jgi:hypothetical protein
LTPLTIVYIFIHGVRTIYSRGIIYFKGGNFTGIKFKGSSIRTPKNLESNLEKPHAFSENVFFYLNVPGLRGWVKLPHPWLTSLLSGFSTFTLA